MDIGIGFIGSETSTSAVRALTLEGITVRTYRYQSPADADEQYRAALAENDAVCFSGVLAYYHRSRELDADIPVLVGSFHEYMIVSSLLASVLDRGVLPDGLSIDLPNADLLGNVGRSLGISFDPALLYEYRDVFSTQFTHSIDFHVIADFHEHHFRSGRTTRAVTSIHWVADILRARGVPHLTMIDTETAQIDLIQKAASRVAISRLADSIAAAIYVTSHGTVPGGRAENAAVFAVLEDFAKQVQTNQPQWRLTPISLFYSTRGEVHNELPVLLEALRKDSLGTETFACGIGYGRHVYEAEEHANQALQMALRQETSNAFIVNEDKRATGPILGEAAEDTIKHTEPWLVDLAQRMSSNSRSLHRFLEFARRRSFQSFTAREWAASTQVSARTGERFIKRAVEAGIVYAVGQEQALGQGRPRNVYALTQHVQETVRHVHQKP